MKTAPPSRRGSPVHPVQNHLPGARGRRGLHTLAPAFEHPLHRHREQPGAQVPVAGFVLPSPHVLPGLQVLGEETRDVLVRLGAFAEELHADRGAQQGLALDLGDGALAAVLGAEAFAALAGAEAEIDR